MTASSEPLLLHVSPCSPSVQTRNPSATRLSESCRRYARRTAIAHDGPKHGTVVIDSWVGYHGRSRSPPGAVYPVSHGLFDPPRVSRPIRVRGDHDHGIRVPSVDGSPAQSMLRPPTLGHGRICPLFLCPAARLHPCGGLPGRTLPGPSDQEFAPAPALDSVFLGLVKSLPAGADLPYGNMVAYLRLSYSGRPAVAGHCPDRICQRDWGNWG
jgi:hypothetical protein